MPDPVKTRLQFAIPQLIALVVMTAGVGDLSAQSTTEEQPLPASRAWRAARIHKSDSGVWYARVKDVQSDYGPPELIVTDDHGRLTVLSVYSGKWTERSVVADRGWLAPSDPADVDARVPGREIYAAGRHGNVHQIRIAKEAFGGWSLHSAEIGHAAGEEFHAIVAADIDASTPGAELLAFAISGAVYLLRPEGEGTRFSMRRLGDVGGRVRDTVVVRSADKAAAPWIAGVSRAGHLLEIRLDAGAMQHRVLAKETMGLGRITRRAQPSGEPATTLYVTRDDGVVLRFTQNPGGDWRRQVVFAGAQGLRGIVSGRFHQDPAREALIVYGYGKDVQLVSRQSDGKWDVETIYSGAQRGHWLAVGNFDGRNTTDEVVATGFDGDVILLSRPPGYGLAPEVAVDTDEKAATRSDDGARPWRIAVKASDQAVRELSPLCYHGGFETKSLLYETLVARGPDGRIVPRLASSWKVSDDGRAFTFRLREGARFHDGQLVDAEAVVTHFRRWVGLPEHAWLRCNARITGTRALSPREFVVNLDKPYALLPDLCAMNPTAIRGPGALDREGAQRHPIGSGPFAFVEAREGGRVLRYKRHDASGGPARYVDLFRLEKSQEDDAVDALLRGEVDAVLSSWLVHVDPARVRALETDPRFRVKTGPGSSMRYLAFRLSGATADPRLRHAIANAIDRDALVQSLHQGLADASRAWAAPSVRIWPQRPQAQQATALEANKPASSLRVVADARIEPGLGEAIVAMLTRAGIAAEFIAGAHASGRVPWDIRIGITHGVPYDPYTTAVSQFVPPANARNAEGPRRIPIDPRVSRLMRRAMATPREDARYEIYADIQALLDREALLVPLYAPRRVAIVRRGMPTPQLTHDMYALDARFLTDVADTPK